MAFELVDFAVDINAYQQINIFCYVKPNKDLFVFWTHMEKRLRRCDRTRVRNIKKIYSEHAQMNYIRHTFPCTEGNDDATLTLTHPLAI